MWFKLILIANLILILISLFGGAFYLTLSNDESNKHNRLLQLLTIRVALSVCLILLLFIGFINGWIMPHTL
jgi:predicted Co/Zn/Cd cation transporter (cation efflux family)